MKRTQARGFTLIELMIVVAIIGILASVALPMMQKATLRTRATERAYMIRAIHASIEDVYRQKDRFPPAPGVDSLTGDWNPALPHSTGKRPFVPTRPGWAVLTGLGAGSAGSGGSLAIEGETYYSYRFVGWETGNPGATIQAEGDLDGDGIASAKIVTLLRDKGTYIPAGEVPAAGQEDSGTF